MAESARLPHLLQLPAAVPRVSAHLPHPGEGKVLVVVRVIVMMACPGLAAGGGPLHHRPLLLPLQDRGAQRQRGRRRPGRARQQEARGLLQVSRKILFYPASIEFICDTSICFF